MLVIAGLSVLLGAAVAHAASSARAAHPPTENMRVRLAPSGVDRRDVPLSDHGRRGGAARTERPLDWRPLYRGRQRAVDGPTCWLATTRAHQSMTVLIVVVAMAALVLTGLVTLVVCKTRTQNRHGIGETIRKQVRENTLDFDVEKCSQPSPMHARRRECRSRVRIDTSRGRVAGVQGQAGRRLR